jgi:hypothetical protein
MDSTLILQKLKEKREAVLTLDRERDRLLAQIAAYEELLPVEVKTDRKPKDAPAESAKSRGLSETSRAFLGRLKQREQFGFDIAVDDALAAGIETDKRAMRSRLHQYVQSGYLARVSDGQFQLTRKGMDAATE